MIFIKTIISLIIITLCLETVNIKPWLIVNNRLHAAVFLIIAFFIDLWNIHRKLCVTKNYRCSVKIEFFSAICIKQFYSSF